MDIILQWTEDLKTENKVIDSQHKILFDLVNDLNLAFKTKVSQKIIDTMFNILITYTFDHFELEESILFEEKDKLQHCYEHYQLIRALNTYINTFRNNRNPDIDPIIFLKEWLLNHITTYDIPALRDIKSEAIEILQLESDNSLPRQERYVINREELRAFKRLPSMHITDEEIIGHCYNASKLKNSSVIIKNLSSGGLSIIDSHITHDIDDLLVISCSIGKNFKMEERFTVKNKTDNSYGLKFFSPSSETEDFFAQLYGSIKLGSVGEHHY